jgi:hypothetical protein
MSERQRIDRREFILAAASAAAVAYVPFGAVAAPAVGATQQSELLADWSIDDQWGVVPRWEAIPCTPRQLDDELLASVHPADRAFVS